MIIFDFDGVIVNTFEQTFELTRRLDDPTMDRERYREMFCGNIFDAGIENRYTTFSGAEAKQAYYREYGKVLAPLPIKPGIDALIAELAMRHALHIVSSADEVSINNFLHTRGLRSHFRSVLGYETAESKVEKFKLLKLHEDPRSHIFITDTLGDLREAAKVGLPSIAVTWGLHDVDRLQKGMPFMIVDNLVQLRTALEKWQSA